MVKAKLFSERTSKFKKSRFTKNQFAVFERSSGSKPKFLKSFKKQGQANQFAVKTANKALTLRKNQPKRRKRFFFTVKLTGAVGKVK